MTARPYHDGIAFGENVMTKYCKKSERQRGIVRQQVKGKSADVEM